MNKKIIIFFSLLIAIFIGIVIYFNTKDNETQKAFNNIGEGTSDYLKGINNAKSYYTDK